MEGRIGTDIRINLLLVIRVHLCVPRHIHRLCSTVMGQRHIVVHTSIITKLIYCALFQSIYTGGYVPFYIVQYIFHLLVVVARSTYTGWNVVHFSKTSGFWRFSADPIPYAIYWHNLACLSPLCGLCLISIDDAHY